MSDVSDFSFQQPATGGAPEPPSGGGRTLIIAATVVLVVVAAAAWFFFGRGTAEQPAEVATTAAPAPAPAPAPPVEPAEAPPVQVPPLDETDGLVRELVSALSSHPRVVAWLATDDLIRNFAVTVENISNGQTPTTHLQVWRPDAEFSVIEDDSSVILDTRSYARYADVADAVDGIDATGAARAYQLLKPRIQEAYQELGYQQSFDVALERAIVLLLRTPVTDDVLVLEPSGALWAFADPSLERLEPAQKQLLRMGPRNARRVQAKLREVALAIGIPASRLP